jgi:hypothetical protein
MRNAHSLGPRSQVPAERNIPREAGRSDSARTRNYDVDTKHIHTFSDSRGRA